MGKNTTSLSKLAIIVALLIVQVIHANVIGFDFGSTFFKISLVSPGKPFTIVENTTSKRKTETVVAIGQENRIWGYDALINAGRNPKATFANQISFLGKEYDEDSLAKLAAEEFVLTDFVQDERGYVAYQTFSVEKKEESVVHYSEELVAMILNYGRDLAVISAGGSRVNDAVITIPSYFTAKDRLLMLDAAELAGIRVIQLVHENVAAAAMLGVDRLDNEKARTIMFYNMGGKDTEVTVARFSAVKDEKGKEFEHVEILAEAWDASLGGQDFDQILIQMLIDKFNSLPERQGKPDVRTNTKAYKRIAKESLKVKDVLSSNKIADVKIPELLDYVTLKTQLLRVDFEEKTEHLLKRVQAPAQEALRLSGLSSMTEIDQVEILGGGLRIPRVSELIREVTGHQDLGVHLNGDEAMCLGSSFIASNFSQQYKVRQLYLTHKPLNDYKITIEPMSTEGLSEDAINEEVNSYWRDTKLFSRDNDYLGAKKTINLSYDRNMKISIYESPQESAEDEKGTLIMTYTLETIDELAKSEAAQKEDSTSPKVSLSFELNRNHLLLLNKAEFKFDETVVEVVVVEKKEAEKEAEKEVEKEVEKEAETKDEESEDIKIENEDKAAEPEVEKLEDLIQEEAAVETETISKVVPHKENIELTVKYHTVTLLTSEQKKEAKNRLRTHDKRDSDKLKNDEARNTYESLIYEFRAWLSEEENHVYMSSQDQESWYNKCNEAEEWLEDEGSHAGYKTYQTKTYDLQAPYTKFSKRAREHKSRSEMVEKMSSMMVEMKGRLVEIIAAKPWISEGEASDVSSKIEETMEWLDKQVAKQEKVGLDEDPVLTSTEMLNKTESVTKLFKKVTEKKKPREKKTPKGKKKDESTEDDKKDDPNSNDEEFTDL